MPKKRPFSDQALQSLSNQLNDTRITLMGACSHLNRHLKKSDELFVQMDSVYNLFLSVSKRCSSEIPLPPPVPKNKRKIPTSAST